MSDHEVVLTAQNEFAHAYAAFDDVIYHHQPPDRLQEHLALVAELVDELARRS